MEPHPSPLDILSSPAKLGELLTLCYEFAEIEPIVREQAETLALQKKEIPGWTLVHCDGNRYVESPALVDVTFQCPIFNLQQLLTTFATLLGSVSESKYKQLCEAAGVTPRAEAVKQSGATVHLRRNPNVVSQNKQ